MIQSAYSGVHLAISHLLTSTPLLLRNPAPLWGSLLLYKLRKWTYGDSSVTSKYLMVQSPCQEKSINISRAEGEWRAIFYICDLSPFHTGKPCLCPGHKRVAEPRCWCPSPAQPLAQRGPSGKQQKQSYQHETRQLGFI